MVGDFSVTVFHLMGIAIRSAANAEQLRSVSESCSMEAPATIGAESPASRAATAAGAGCHLTHRRTGGSGATAFLTGRHSAIHPLGLEDVQVPGRPVSANNGIFEIHPRT